VFIGAGQLRLRSGRRPRRSGRMDPGVRGGERLRSRRDEGRLGPLELLRLSRSRGTEVAVSWRVKRLVADEGEADDERLAVRWRVRRSLGVSLCTLAEIVEDEVTSPRGRRVRTPGARCSGHVRRRAPGAGRSSAMMDRLREAARSAGHDAAVPVDVRQQRAGDDDGLRDGATSRHQPRRGAAAGT
jgi:hypothetical protein